MTKLTEGEQQMRDKLKEILFRAGWNGNLVSLDHAIPAIMRELEVKHGAKAKPVAWMAVMDNTEGIRGNKPQKSLCFSKRNPFGIPGRDYSESFPVTITPLYAAPQPQPQADADISTDKCIELAQALEQQRAIKIAESVAAISASGHYADMPTTFHVGYQMACEEIIHRLRTEEWDFCLPPVDAAMKSENPAPGA